MRVRLLLGDPDGVQVARRGEEEGIGAAMAAKIRNALVLLAPLLRAEGTELRLHDAVLYNSIFRGGDEMLVNHHVYGVGAAFAPVMHLDQRTVSALLSTYQNSFETVWKSGRTLPRATPQRKGGAANGGPRPRR